MQLALSAFVTLWFFRLGQARDDSCTGGLSECTPWAVDEIVASDGIESSLLQQQHSLESPTFQKGAYGSDACPSGYQEITFASQCEKAAAALDVKYSGAKSSKGSPRGCMGTNNGFASFNLVDQGSASVYYYVLCETKEEAKHADPDPFVKAGTSMEGCPSGSDYQDIEYASECKKAAQSLGLKYDEGTSSKSSPPGCLSNSMGNVYFNIIEDKGSASPYHSVICETKKAAKHAKPDGFTQTGTNQLHCPSTSKYKDVKTASKCADGAEALGFKYDSVTSSHSSPKGCIYRHNGVSNIAYFNEIDGEGSASSYHHLICEAKKAHDEDGGDEGGSSSKKVEGHLKSKSMGDSCIHAKSYKGTNSCGTSKNRWSYHTKHLTLSGAGKCLHVKNGRDVEALECDKHDTKFQWAFDDCNIEQRKCSGHIVNKKNGKCLSFDDSDGKLSLKKCNDSDKTQKFKLKD